MIKLRAFLKLSNAHSFVPDLKRLACKVRERLMSTGFMWLMMGRMLKNNGNGLMFGQAEVLGRFMLRLGK